MDRSCQFVIPRIMGVRNEEKKNRRVNGLTMRSIRIDDDFGEGRSKRESGRNNNNVPRCTHSFQCTWSHLEPGLRRDVFPTTRKYQTPSIMSPERRDRMKGKKSFGEGMVIFMIDSENEDAIL